MKSDIEIDLRITFEGEWTKATMAMFTTPQAYAEDLAEQIRGSYECEVEVLRAEVLS